MTRGHRHIAQPLDKAVRPTTDRHPQKIRSSPGGFTLVVSVRKGGADAVVREADVIDWNNRNHGFAVTYHPMVHRDTTAAFVKDTPHQLYD